MLGDVNKLFVFNSIVTMPSNVLPFHLKQTFPPLIWIFTEDEGDEIESRLPFKIFSTLTHTVFFKWATKAKLFQVSIFLINQFHFLKSFWVATRIKLENKYLLENQRQGNQGESYYNIRYARHYNPPHFSMSKTFTLESGINIILHLLFFLLFSRGLGLIRDSIVF